MSLQLTPAELAIVQNILLQHVPEHVVWVFGSRARGTAKAHSDLDLVLRGATLSLATQAALADAFDESLLPFKVDVVDWASASPEFQALIAANHLPLPKQLPL